MAELVAIAMVRVGERHRKDHGDLQILADSIAAVGLLQPIGITGDGGLVFGERRLMACRDILGWPEIPARVVDVRSIVEGEFHENEVRKDFTPSERVAIGRTIEQMLGNRRGERTDLGPNDAKSSKGKTAEIAGQRSGFESEPTYRRAKKVVDKGTPELVEAMDRGVISISAAADLADETQDEQRTRLKLPTKKEAVEQSKATGAAVLARDGKYHAHVEPEREAQTELWLSFKDVLWPVADQHAVPAAIVAAVPPYQHDEFDCRLRAARDFLDRLAVAWENRSEQLAAE